MGSIASQYINNRSEHDKTARLWTKKYASKVAYNPNSVGALVNDGNIRNSETPRESETTHSSSGDAEVEEIDAEDSSGSSSSSSSSEF